MTEAFFPTPAQVRKPLINHVELAAARIPLRNALIRNRGHRFTIGATLIPERFASILIDELRRAGWSARFVADSHTEDYYIIDPA